MCEFFRHVGAFLERAFKATSVRDGFCMAGVYPYSARQIMSTCRDGSWCQLDKTAFPGYELSEAEQKVLTAVDMAARNVCGRGEASHWTRSCAKRRACPCLGATIHHSTFTALHC